MTDQKHEETATSEGMPEAPPPPPPIEWPWEKKDEVAHLRQRVHEMEETLHTFLTHQTSVGHDRITSWLNKVRGRLFHSTQPAQTETTPPGQPSDKEPTESSTSKT